MSDPEGKSNARAILTLTIENELLQCKLRPYSMPQLARTVKIGIYHKKEVSTANLIEKRGYYLSSLVGDFDMDEDFYSALVNTADNSLILAGGTYAGYFYSTDEDKNKLTDIFSSENTKLDNECDDRKEFEFDDNIQNKSNDDIPTKANSCKETDSCERCKDCIYKEYFYSNQKTDCGNDINNDEDNHMEMIENENSPTDNISLDNDILNQQEEINSTNSNNLSKDKSDNQVSSTNQSKYNISVNINKEDLTLKNNEDKLESSKGNEQKEPIKVSQNILDSIVSQFEYVFANFPENSELNALLENAKFVKIDENGEEYSIGSIYENDEMKYICYAVRANYNQPAPIELGQFYQWLPIDSLDPLSNGYYIVYQDAKDLKIIEV